MAAVVKRNEGQCAPGCKIDQRTKLPLVGQFRGKCIVLRDFFHYLFKMAAKVIPFEGQSCYTSNIARHEILTL